MRQKRKSNYLILKKICLVLLKKENSYSVNEIAREISSKWKTTMDAINLLVWLNIVLELEREGITRQYKLTESGKHTVFLRSLQSSQRNKTDKVIE